MKKKTIVLSVVAASLALSFGCVTAFATESDAYSYHTEQQNSTNRNDLYEKTQELTENEQNFFG